MNYKFLNFMGSGMIGFIITLQLLGYINRLLESIFIILLIGLVILLWNASRGVNTKSKQLEHTK